MVTDVVAACWALSAKGANTTVHNSPIIKFDLRMVEG
jgi:hypothetical protein